MIDSNLHQDKGNRKGAEPGRPAWTNNLVCTKHGTPQALFRNAVTALREHPGWQGVLGFDLFAHQTMVLEAPPFILSNLDWEPRSWTDEDDLECCNWLQHQRIAVTRKVTADAVELVAHDRSYHPVIDYLEDAEKNHDGKARLDRMAMDYFGTEDTVYNRLVFKHLMIAAIARIYQPACKVDTVPIFEGDQGFLKSTAIKTLFEPWFSDEISELGSKDASLQVRGIWCIELGELDAMHKTEVSRVKAFISRTTDRFRPPYARRVGEFPRCCIFVGSTNGEGYLKDETGNRRFQPVEVCLLKPIDIEALKRDRDQLFAEAVILYKAGVKWWMVKEETIAAAAKAQDDRYVGDPWDGPVSEYLDSLRYMKQVGGYQVAITTILGTCFNIPASQWTQADMNRVARILRRLNWRRHQLRTGDRRQWVYRKTSSEPESDELPDDVTTHPQAQSQSGDATGDEKKPSATS